MVNPLVKYSKSLLVLSTVVLLGIALGVGLGVGLKRNDSKDGKRICFSDLQKTLPNFSFPHSTSSKHIPIDKCPAAELTCPRSQRVPPLIVVSLDGFRADYLLRNMTPNLAKIVSCGASTSYMRAMFPTKTFPNHYTIATGLYPESHGIIDNVMFDLRSNRTFLLKNHEVEDNFWYKGEPIWNTATKAGRKVVSMMWPGSAVDVQDMRPEWCYRFNNKVTYASKIEEVLQYFNPDQTTHPDAAFIYIEQPDAAGHRVGPFGDWVNGNLTLVDDLVGALVRGMEERGYGDCVNYVIVADHGMQRVDCYQTLNMTSQLPYNDYFLYTGSHSRLTSKYLLNTTLMQFYHNSKPVPVEETMERLQCRNFDNPLDWNVRFYQKKDLPKRYHYSNNPLIDDIVLDLEANFVTERFTTSKCTVAGGSHGSDNTYKSMHALFVAMGSSIQHGVMEPFENIELYNLFADLMQISPASTNGTHGTLWPVLNQHPHTSNNLLNNTAYVNCGVPDTNIEKINRRQKTHLPKLDPKCFDSKTENDLDNLLKLSPDDTSLSINRHLPLGLIGSAGHSNSCLLVQPDFISAFSKPLQLPLWTSFSLDYFAQLGIGDSNVLNGRGISEKNKKNMECIRGDVRVDDAVEHTNYNVEEKKIQKAFLFPPGFIQDDRHIADAHLLSNIVPMFTDFQNGVWRDAIKRVEEYAEKYKRINVVLGPVFDYNADGLADSMQEIESHKEGSKVPIPTHYFVSIFKCNSTQTDMKCFTSVQVLSIILPHLPHPHSCWDKRKELYSREHAARLKDVELLTSLAYLTGVSDLVLRSGLITRLSEHLWRGWDWLDDSTADSSISEQPRCPPGYSKDKIPLLLVSIDGFRADYFDYELTPVLKKLHEEGTSTKYMQSMYPTVTFPNHYSIITGLYTESHGIVDNKMFDPVSKSFFSLGSASTADPSWWIGEPLWVRLEKLNKTAMAYFWPGTDVEIHGTRPTEYRVYNSQTPHSVRVSTVLEWLSNATGVLPDLVTLYFSKVDEAGHDGGPGSLQVKEAMMGVDEAMRDLMNGLLRQNLLSCINIVLVSDHGMGDISLDHNIRLSELLTQHQNNLTYIYEGAAARIATNYSFPSADNIIPEADRINPEEIVDQINKGNDSNLLAFLKTSLAKRYHYANSDRIDQVVLMLAERWQAVNLKEWSIMGTHGWDAFYKSMQSLFIGWGQAFQQQTKYEHPFENIELYNILSHLTGITPGPNNGTWGSLHHLLKTPPLLENPSTPPSSPPPCIFPSDAELAIRANYSYYSCPAATYDFERLKKSEDDMKRLLQKHVSSGLPKNVGDESTKNNSCLLYHDDFVSLFDKKKKLPKWSSFRLSSSSSVSSSSSSSSSVSSSSSSSSSVSSSSSSSSPTFSSSPPNFPSIPDVRLQVKEQYNCSQWDSIMQQLYHRVPLFDYGSGNAGDAGLLSNMVPMQETFTTHVWAKVKRLIKEMEKERDVIVGPVFDYDNDGLADDDLQKFVGDIPIPSHYFVIVLPVLQDTSQPNFDSLAFVLPNSSQEPTDLFETAEQFILENKARIRDVELLTGLEFLGNFSTEQHSIRTRTFITAKSWRSVFNVGVEA